MEGIRFRKGLTGLTLSVQVNREGIAIHRLWQGTKLLPWELIDAVYAAPLPWTTLWKVHVKLVDGTTGALPVPGPSAYGVSDDMRRAVTAIEEIRREAAPKRWEPEDHVPWEYRAAAVKRLTVRGGMPRNGLLCLLLAIFGLLGFLVMDGYAQGEFGTAALSGTPGTCPAASVAQGDADHDWCTVTDGYVREIDNGPGGITLWLGPKLSAGEDPQDNAVYGYFMTDTATLNGLRVGDQVDYLTQNGGDVESVTVQDTTVHGVPNYHTYGTAEGERLAEYSGFFAAACWPLFFALFAACQRWPHRTRHAHWALPALAACWFTGLIGLFGHDHSAAPADAVGLVRVGLIAILVATAAYVPINFRHRPFAQAR